MCHNHKKINFTILIAMLCFFSCTKETSISEEKKEEETVFTINIANDLDTSNSDNWIILHNKNGQLLSYSAYESSATLTFDAESSLITDKINVTLLIYRPDIGNSKIHEITTYTDIDKGGVWNFNPTAPEFIDPAELRGERIGDVEVNIQLLNIDSDCLISDAHGRLGGTSTGTNGLLTKSISSYENSKEYMVLTTHPDGSLRYNFIIDPESNNNLNHSEFKEFDSFVNVMIPPNIDYFSIVYGFEDDQKYSSSGGFVLNNKLFPFNNPFLSTNSLSLGYLDRFNRYRTELNYSMDNYFYSLKKYGSKPESIGFTENATLTVLDESISNFRFETDLAFNRRGSIWFISEGQLGVDSIATKWTVESSGFNPTIIGAIPEEILDQYPNIKIDDLGYSGTKVYMNFDSYSEFIQKKFIPNEINSPFDSEEYILFF